MNILETIRLIWPFSWGASGVAWAICESANALTRVQVMAISASSRGTIDSVLALQRLSIASIGAGSRIEATTESNTRLTIDDIGFNE